MRFLLERVSNPEIEPVSLAELKANLRTFDSSTGEDNMLNALIQASREWVENYTGRALVDQQWRLTIDRLGYLVGNIVSGYMPWIGPGSGPDINRYAGLLQICNDNFIQLRKSPILSIVSMVSVAADGTETTIDASTYELREADSKWPRIVALSGSTWITGTFRIVFRAGYADTTSSPQQDASVVPNRYKQAMMLYAEALYDRDPTMMPLLIKTAENLIKPECCELRMA